MRATVQRQWTEEERADALRLIRVLSAYPNTVVGVLWLRRAVGMTEARIRDLMPLVAILAADAHPGWMVVPEDRTFTWSNDSRLLREMAQRRARPWDTKGRRLVAEFRGAAAEAGAGLLGASLANAADQVQVGLDSVARLLDATTD